MKKPEFIQLHIPNPCNENWDRMSEIKEGRYCNSCQHAVIDFTGFTDAQLHQFFAIDTSTTICGNFRVSQLNRAILIPPQPHSKLYRLVIAAGLTILAIIPMNDARARFQPPYTIENIMAPDKEQNRDSTIAIRGLILDEKREPMIGAVVQLFDGERNIGGAATDIDGLFKIQPIHYSPGRQLEMRVSFTSYFTEKVIVDVENLSSSYEVQMKINPEGEEVIVMRGYVVPLIDRHNNSNTIDTAKQSSSTFKGKVKYKRNKK